MPVRHGGGGVGMYWLPVGSWEPHGAHLPEDTDTRIARRLAQAAAAPADVVLPAIGFGCSFEHRRLGRLISLRVATFAALLTDIVRAVPDPLVVVNGHGGNTPLDALAQEWAADGRSVLVLPTRAQWAAAYAAAGWDFGPHDDMHAGAMERSLLLHWEPEVVGTPAPADHAVPDRPLFTARGMAGYAPTGIIGYPQAASAEAGRRAAAALVAALRETVAAWTHD